MRRRRRRWEGETIQRRNGTDQRDSSPTGLAIDPGLAESIILHLVLRVLGPKVPAPSFPIWKRRIVSEGPAAAVEAWRPAVATVAIDGGGNGDGVGLLPIVLWW